MVLDLKPGDFVDDRYEILGLLGVGGMGSVHQAREKELDRVVALKLLHHSLVADSEHQERFKREGLILAELCHPNIRSCYRFGIWQQQYPYIAMELLHGSTLASLIASSSLPPNQVLKLGVQACAGMAHAHAHGIIHRDLKPGNLMIEPINSEEVVKIVDFGLARLIPDGSGNNQHLTQTGSLIGSVSYMSPEQCLGRKADKRSDIYSLACVLYEALTGEPPLVADNPIGLMHFHANVLPQPLPKVVGEHIIPGGLNAVLMKALNKVPENRQQTMTELAQQLQLVLDGRGDEIAENAALKPGKSKAALWLVPLVLVLGCLAVFLFRHSQEDPFSANKTLPNSIVRRDILSTYKQGNTISPAKREELLTLWLAKYGAVERAGACLAHFQLADLQCPALFSISHAVIPAQDCLEPKGEASNANFTKAEKLFGHVQKTAGSKVLDQILYFRVFALKGRKRPTHLRTDCRSVISQFGLSTPSSTMHLYYQQLANLFSLAGEYKDEARVRQELSEHDNPLYRLSNKLFLLHSLNLRQPRKSKNSKPSSFAQYLARYRLNYYDGLNHRNAALCLEENLPKEAQRFLDCCDCTFVRTQGRSTNAEGPLTSTPFLAEASSDRRDTDRIQWAGREAHQFIWALSLIENHQHDEARKFILRCLKADDPQLKLWLLPCLVHNAKEGQLPIDPIVRKMINGATANDINWLCNLGICALKEDAELAGTALRKCAALVLQAEGEGDSMQTGLLVADGLMQQNTPDDAKVLLEALLELSEAVPPDVRKYQLPVLYLYLSKANRASNNPAAAATLLSKASEGSKGKIFSRAFDAAVLHEKAVQHALRQEWAPAQAVFEELVSPFSLDVAALDRARYLEDYARFCMRRGQPKKAEELERRAEIYLPHDARIYWMAWPVVQTEIRKIM
ncbi:MAG: serine/threonine protein kinase [Candidatus Obscuribacterales bacterium]|nr:serine/threonine protein kinase [Candidatus Obscuribacterales bacterium]